MNTPPETDEKKQQWRRLLRKKRQSKLDPYSKQLLQMDADKQTIPQMIEWLKGQNVKTSRNNVSNFLTARREERELERLGKQIASGAKKCKAIRQWLAKNPKPQLETVIEVFKILITDLSTKEAVDPELIQLADKLARTSIQFANDASRAVFRERKQKMDEQKFAEWKKSERMKAMEYCMEEAKGTPAEPLFRQAFKALLKARGK
jgi:hypothetical protein